GRAAARRRASAPHPAMARAPASSGGGASSSADRGRVAGAPAVAPNNTTSAAGAGSAASSGSAEVSTPRLDRMIIATVNLSVTVENAVQAARVAERIADAYGGFVGTSTVRDSETSREATLTLRIPQPSLNHAM